MTRKELEDILVSTGLPTVFYSFKASGKEVALLPYIVYLTPSTENFGADNKVYKKTTNYNIELYSEEKDEQSEQKIEDVLDTASIFYNKTEAYIEKEEFYEVLYRIQI